MTPKEKAKELMDEMFKHIQYAAYPYPTKAVIAAKNCALVAVEEILLSYPLEPFKGSYYELTQDRQDEAEKFWKEVKQEIEKL